MKSVPNAVRAGRLTETLGVWRALQKIDLDAVSRMVVERDARSFRSGKVGLCHRYRTCDLKDLLFSMVRPCPLAHQAQMVLSRRGGGFIRSGTCGT